jgi:hypothetical protein
MPRTKRTPAQLREASAHLHYELWMFATLARALATGVFGQGAVNNAVLESFTIHARVLLDFLFADKPRSDDIIAEDFFAEPEEWAVLRGVMPPALVEVNRRVGKEVAHLTYSRLEVTPSEKSWQFLEIASDMENVMARFCNHVSPEYLELQWKQKEK